MLQTYHVHQALAHCIQGKSHAQVCNHQGHILYPSDSPSNVESFLRSSVKARITLLNDMISAGDASILAACRFIIALERSARAFQMREIVSLVNTSHYTLQDSSLNLQYLLASPASQARRRPPMYRLAGQPA